jgi:hypothetical protein
MPEEWAAAVWPRRPAVGQIRRWAGMVASRPITAASLRECRLNDLRGGSQLLSVRAV